MLMQGLPRRVPPFQQPEQKHPPRCADEHIRRRHEEVGYRNEQHLCGQKGEEGVEEKPWLFRRDCQQPAHQHYAQRSEWNGQIQFT